MVAFKPVKKSLIGPSEVFVCILLFFVSVFVISNVNNLLTSLGFETKENVSVKLAKSDAELKTAIEVNAHNVQQLEEQKQVTQQLKDELAKASIAIVNASNTVVILKEKKAKKDAPVIAKIAKETVVTEDTITLPIKEVNALSASNIEHINDVYSQLFPSI